MPLVKILFFSAAVALCPGADIQVPVLGYAFDPAAHALRPIAGTPGAALLSRPLDLGFPVASAWISPRQEIVIAVDGASGRVRMLRKMRSGLEFIAEPAGTGIPDTVVFSPEGRAAVLRTGGRLQVITGFPSAPAIAFESAAAEETVAAVSDSGRSAIVIRPDGSSALIRDGVCAGDTGIERVTAAAFRASSEDSVLVSDSEGVIVLRQDGSRSALSSDPRLRRATGVAVSSDGSRVFLATAAGQVAIVQLTTGEIAWAECNCKPGGLERIGAGPLFRLSGGSTSPVLVFDAMGSEPRVWFIPSDRASGPGGE